MSTKEYYREWRKKNPDKEKAKKKKYRMAHKQESNKYNKTYWASHPQQRASHHRSWKKKNPGKADIYELVRMAIRCCVLIKSKTCSICNAGGRIVGHHSDYSKPLAVIWVCIPCHHKIHSSIIDERKREDEK